MTTWFSQFRSAKYQTVHWLLWTLVELPIVFQCLLFSVGGVLMILVELLGWQEISWIDQTLWQTLVTALVFVPSFLLLFWLEFRRGRRWAAQSQPLQAESVWARYFPYLIPVLYGWSLWTLTWLLPDWESQFMIAFFPFLPFLPLLGMVALSGTAAFWLPVIHSGIYLLAATAFATGTWKSGRLAVRFDWRVLCVCALLGLLVAASSVQEWIRYHSLLHEDPQYPALLENRYTHRYRPFANDSAKNLTPLRQSPALRFTSDFPRLDGATALFPIYAAAAQALYAPPEFVGMQARLEFEENVQCSTTPRAYDRLIDGHVDLIFAAAPSKAQEALAAEKGLQFTLTPFAQEAFVFLVNAQNPVNGLSVEQIRAIYSGQTNDWKDVGGLPEKIMPFQREANSGSQTVMEKFVMRELALRKPLEEERIEGMGGLVRSVADYRNYKNALGYSFRFYVTKMNSAPGIKLLEIDGVAPTVENIRAGRYPLTETVYMVTIKDRPQSGHTRQLQDWFLSEAGQQLVEDVGYVGLASQ
ncbi:MAG: substrate-binding domain-containing protein [Burkholderiaceae bacterium]|jgi:phosphate transport system substrate-binding protein|nr:substrate-binding domain-containing protein [Burkholderiaceae bacterium]